MLAAALEMGHEPPAGVVAAMDLWPACQPYRSAWLTLHAARVFDGMSGLPRGLPYTEMRAYASDHGLDDDLAEYLELMQVQERVFLDWAHEQHAAHQKKP